MSPTDRSTASPRRVSLKRAALEAYREPVGEELIAEVRELAADLRGLRLRELSATATGGGVAELLSSLVPLERDLGVEAEWRVIAGDAGFFEITKRIHKGTAMVAGRAGGIPEQLEDGVGGYLAESVEEFAARVTELLENPLRAGEMGAAGAEAVRRRFLLPRLLRDHLAMLRDLVT